MKNDIKVLHLPKADASESELVEHFKKVGGIFACITYDVAIYLCITCCKDGENTFGKKGSASDRNRFCSAECEALWERRWALYATRKGVLKVAEKQQGDSPSVERRKATKTKRVGRPGGPKCGRCGQHPRSATHREQCGPKKDEDNG